MMPMQLSDTVNKKISAVVGKHIGKQAFLNGEIHDWYRIILGYSDHLVSGLIDRFDLSANDRVLDPFCGTGTTLVECMKRGIPSIGIDANPSSCFAAKVKTDWGLDPDHLLMLLEKVREDYTRVVEDVASILADPTYQYLNTSGMINRGWICLPPLIKVIGIKLTLNQLRTTPRYRRVLMLGLTAELVSGASNVKFGPEIYCSKPKMDVDVLAGFTARIINIANDLRIAMLLDKPQTKVLEGDSRNCSLTIKQDGAGTFSAVITSPPYPTEHDYTRNSRLELALLECVTDLQSLREIKYEMIRSHTKGIYVTDNDSRSVKDNALLKPIIKEIDERVASKTHGFAQLYSTVVTEYFGGMRRHLRSLKPVLRKQARCAYIVGDQSSYLQVYIPTATILASLAEEVGFEVENIEQWRQRRSTKTSHSINENILFLRKR